MGKASHTKSLILQDNEISRSPKSRIKELPWNQATLDISDYSKWKENDIETSGHWQRIQDNLLLSLIKKMLNHGPSKRYNLNQIKNHLWFKKKFKDSDGSLLEPEIALSPPKKVVKHEDVENKVPPSFDRLWASQPAPKTQATQSNRFQRLVKRMTRFWVKVSLEETDKFLHGLLEKMHYAFKCKSKGIFTIETQDRRGAILSFRCSLI